MPAARPIDENALVERIWNRDVALWGGPETPEVADRLGWLDVPERMRGVLGELEEWAGVLRSEFDGAVLLGMGGSSLGPEVLRRSFGRPLTMLDGTHPVAVRDVAESVGERTCFVVSSKSGSTIETLSHLAFFYDRVGGDGSRFTAVTDPGSPLAARARELGFAKTWLADPEIGGRFSVLSHFGLVPAALAGIPLVDVVDSAVAEMESCRSPACRWASSWAVWPSTDATSSPSRSLDRLSHSDCGPSS